MKNHRKDSPLSKSLPPSVSQQVELEQLKSRAMQSVWVCVSAYTVLHPRLIPLISRTRPRGGCFALWQASNVVWWLLWMVMTRGEATWGHYMGTGAAVFLRPKILILSYWLLKLFYQQLGCILIKQRCVFHSKMSWLKPDGVWGNSA